MALEFEYDKEKRTATVCGVEDKSCEQIVIPSTVEYCGKKYDVVAIKGYAFRECLKLKSVTITDGVTKIGCDAFYGCINLKKFKGKFAVDNGRCLIKDDALIAYASASGTTYAIPYSVTKIRGGAFLGCSSLTSVTIPNSVSEIGWSAFSGCRSLTSVTIPNSVTEIGGYAFNNCKSLTSITIPDSVTKIESTTFRDCTSLTSVTIPNSVTMIGESAFSGCRSLTSITIPDSVTEIGGLAFKGCSNLKEFKGKFAADNGRCLIEDGALIAYASASGTTYAIPDGVTEIEGSAFSGCSSLTSVTIPNSVTKIGDFAFQWCSKLENVDICNEEGCVKILPLAFRSATKVTYLGKDAQPKKKGFFARLFGKK